MTSLLKKMSLALGLGLLLSTSTLAQAAYPDRAVTIVVNYAPGGPLDLLARIVGEYASKKTGQPVVIENKPGAAGQIGGEYVARQKPDGYTLLWTVDTLYTVNPYIYKTNFNPAEDLRTSTLAGKFSQVLLVNPQLNVSTLDELLEKADVVYSSAGIAAPGHLTMEMLRLKTGMDMLHIPYKGNAPASQALLAGEVDAGFLALGGAHPYIESKKLIPIAVSGAQRDLLLPEVPTLQELAVAGLEDFDVEFGYILMAPKGTEDEILDYWSQLVNEAFTDPDVLKRIARLNITPNATTPAEALIYLDQVAAQWQEVVDTANISVE